MRRNCNLELRLDRTSLDTVDKDEEDKQQLTIFYNGKISVCDATELQAQSIIWLASREVKPDDSPRFDPPSPALSSPVCSPATGLKRSLMRFLHKRKIRVQATSPYPINMNSNKV